MSIVDWLSILVGISSGALAGGISYGLLRGEVRALRRETDIQREMLRECREHVYQLAQDHRLVSPSTRLYKP